MKFVSWTNVSPSAFRLVSVLLLGSLATTASATDPVGYVSGKTGAGADLMRNGTNVPVQIGLPLYPHDKLKVTKLAASVELRLSSHTGPVLLENGDILEISEPAKANRVTKASRFVKSLAWAFKLEDRTETRNTAARNSETDGQRDFIALSPVPVLNTERLKITHDFPDLLVRWCGDASDVEAWLEPDLPMVLTVQNGKRGSLVLTGLREESEFEGVAGPTSIAILPVTAKDNALTLDLDWVEILEVPRPEWLSQTLSAMTSDDIFAWAQWLLYDAQFANDKKYNLIALNLLAKIRDESWEAALALDLATQCSEAQ